MKPSEPSPAPDRAATVQGHGHAAAAAAPPSTTLATDGADLEGGGTELEWVESDRYALVQEIARGGGGRIAIALDRKLGRRIALKRPLDPGASRRLEREAMVMARLEHPSIVPIHDIGREHDGTPFYAMKLLGGPNLSERIRGTKRFEERLELLRVAGAAADAMAYAHTKGVLHRDLKPANVVVGEFGEVAVIDWGLAKIVGDGDTAPRGGGLDAELTSEGDVLGTPAYMAPEQAAGRPVDPRADVYALGAILYQVLTGELPYGRIPGDAQLAELLAGPPVAAETREPRIPADLAAIVAKAMAREPDDRYPTARELADDLHRYQTGRMVAAHRYSTWTRARRWLRRHAVVVTGATAGLAIAGMAIFELTRAGAAPTTCTGLDRPAREAWSDDARAAIARAFGDELPAARAAVERALDDRAAGLTAMRLEACDAREAGVQSASIVDDRMACLDERTGELRAVAGAIAHLQPSELDRAQVILGAMGALDQCADLRRVREAPLPTNPQLRADVLAVAERLSAMEADDLADHIHVELAVAPTVLGRAIATGHGPVIAHALERLGHALAASGRAAAAEEVLDQAVIASERAGDDLRRGAALLGLANLAGVDHARMKDAEVLADQALAVAEHTGDARLRAAASIRLAETWSRTGRVDRGIALARQVVELERGPAGAPVLEGQALAELANDLAIALRYDEARAVSQEALRVLRKATVGADHTSIASVIQALGIMDGLQGHYAAAVDEIREADAMLERVLGPDAEQTLNANQSLAEFLKMTDRFAEAEQVLLATRERLERKASPNPDTLGDTNNSLGSVLALEHEFPEALAAYQRALGVRPDPDERMAGLDHDGIGNMANTLGQPDRAIAEMTAAIAILERPGTADVYYAADAHKGKGEALLARGRAADAVAELERARPGLAALGDDGDRGQLEWDLAKAWLARGDRAAARSHAAAARALLVEDGPDVADTLRAVDAWIAAHVAR